MAHLVEVGKALHNEQAHATEGHLLQVEVFHHKDVEVVPCHSKEQGIGAHRVGGVGKHIIVRLVSAVGEWSHILAHTCGCGVVGEASGPQHSTQVAASAVGLASLSHLFQYRRCHGCHVGLRITLKHILQSRLEVVVAFFGHIRESVDKHELRHYLRERIACVHLLVGGVHFLVAVVDVGIVGAFVHRFLVALHVAQVVEVVGVAHCLPVGTFGEVVHYQVAVGERRSLISHAHIHEVEVVVAVEAIDIVGIAREQRVEFRNRAWEIFELVLEDNRHIVETFLNDVVAGGAFLVGLRDLLQVIFHIVRVFFLFPRFGINAC